MQVMQDSAVLGSHCISKLTSDNVGSAQSSPAHSCQQVHYMNASKQNGNVCYTFTSLVSYALQDGTGLTLTWAVLKMRLKCSAIFHLTKLVSFLLIKLLKYADKKQCVTVSHHILRSTWTTNIQLPTESSFLASQSYQWYCSAISVFFDTNFFLSCTLSSSSLFQYLSWTF